MCKLLVLALVGLVAQLVDGAGRRATIGGCVQRSSGQTAAAPASGPRAVRS